MSGSRRRRNILGYYEYFMPGIYDYPVIQCAAIPAGNAAYVAGPMGVINYLSDMQTHLALPTSENVETGLICTTIDSSPCFHEPIREYVQMEDELTEDEGYGYEIPELVLCFNPSNSESAGADESGDSQRTSSSCSSVEISEQSGSGEYVKSESEPRKRRKVSQKRIYTAEQGYVVEEPTSEQSEDDDEKLPPTKS
uniref:GG11087 n=1 Tax=Drosophila erecta TaxID=7220 RepID=B3P8R2_DROER